MLQLHVQSSTNNEVKLIILSIRRTNNLNFLNLQIKISIVEDWVVIGGRLLKYHPEPATWVDAVQICAEQEGLLVIDDNPEVTVYLAGKGQCFISRENISFVYIQTLCKCSAREKFHQKQIKVKN